jgi:hypothetical protein
LKASLVGSGLQPNECIEVVPGPDRPGVVSNELTFPGGRSDRRVERERARTCG